MKRGIELTVSIKGKGVSLGVRSAKPSQIPKEALSYRSKAYNVSGPPMLPRGKKSLAEIRDLRSADDRVENLCKLLEYLIVKITPEVSDPKAEEDPKTLNLLLKRYRNDFSNFRALSEGRRVRNWLVHGDGNPTTTQVLQAEIALDQAVKDILPRCPPDLQQEVAGQKRTPKPPFADTKKAEERVDSAPSTPETSQYPESSSRWGNSDPQRFVRERVSPALVGGGLLLAVLLAVSVVHALRPKTPSTATAVEQSREAVARLQVTTSPLSPTAGGLGITTAVPKQSSPPDLEFSNLVNSRVTLSSLRPNVALVIDAPKQTGAISIADLLNGFVDDQKVHIVLNLVNPKALKDGGFFDDFFSGNGSLLRDAARISKVDYILLGKAEYGFRQQAGLDPNLITCDLNLNFELSDRQGTIARSAAFSAAGPGFTEAQAIEGAAKNAAQQLTTQLLASLP